MGQEQSRIALPSPGHAYEPALSQRPPFVPAFVDTELQYLRKGEEEGQKGRKPLKIRVHYPTEPVPKHKIPIIVWSHGALGSREGYHPLATMLASWGYVTVHPTHDDSLKEKREVEGVGSLFKAGGVRQHLKTELCNPQKWRKRVEDVKVVLDSLEYIQESVLPRHLQGMLDLSRLAAGGHSYGAYTSQLLGGAKVNLSEGSGDGSLADLHDDRLKCTLLISPQGVSSQSNDFGGLTESSWIGYRCPMMVITGTKDNSFSNREDSYHWRCHSFTFGEDNDIPKYKVVIKDADHGMGGIAGHEFFSKMMGWQVDPLHLFYVKMASLAFFDAHLKEDTAAVAYLQHENYLEACSAGAISFERKGMRSSSHEE
jgi:dienelactone hydrolase